MRTTWHDTISQDAGSNSIKMMLYHTMLRPLTDRHAQLAAKLYNVYCFGYPIAMSLTITDPAVLR